MGIGLPCVPVHPTCRCTYDLRSIRCTQLTRMPNLEASMQRQVVNLLLAENYISQIPAAYFTGYISLKYVDLTHQRVLFNCTTLPMILEFNIRTTYCNGTNTTTDILTTQGTNGSTPTQRPPIPPFPPGWSGHDNRSSSSVAPR